VSTPRGFGLREKMFCDNIFLAVSKLIDSQGQLGFSMPVYLGALG